MKFCKAPFSSITFNVDGNYKPCHQFDKTYAPGPDQNLNEIWTSPEMTDLRSFYSTHHTHHPHCSRCETQENLGLTSRRKVYQKMNEDPRNPTWVDIRLSNLCNLKCRSCSSDFSSSWIPDSLKLAKSDFILGSNKLMVNNDHILLSSLENPEVMIIEIKGGEPILSISNFMKKQDRLGPFKKVLRLTTNATTMTEEAYKFLKMFERVEFKLSVDYVRDIFRPIRGSEIRQIENFVERISSLKNIKIEIQTVISAYNLTELSEIILWKSQLSKKFPQINICGPSLENLVIVPEYLSPFVYPESIAKRIQTFLFKIASSDERFKDLENLGKLFLSSETIRFQTQYEKFERFTKTIDQMRGENLWETLQDELARIAK